MKLKNYSLLLFLLYFPLSVFSQSFEWGGRFGGVGEDVVKKMHVDASGNSYVTGYFTDTADFDISADEFNLTSQGFYDAFVQKTNANGELEWAVSVGGTMFDYGTGISSDDQGNVYITGYFDETVDFDPGVGEAFLTSQGGGDVFILKLNSAGEFVWAKSIGGTGYEESTSIGVDELGNVYVLGYIYETMDFNPGPDEFLLSSQGGSDTFLLKLDSAGDFSNAYTYGGNDLDLALDINVKSSSQIFITGFFGGTTDLDPRPSEVYTISAPSGHAGYAMQIDETGAPVNVAHTQGGEVTVYAITADNANNMYYTGSFSGTVNFDVPSGNSNSTFTSDMAYNGFVVKVLANGTIAWARHLTSDKPFLPYDIVVGGDGKVYSTGFFEGPADFNPDPSQEFLLTKQSSNPMDAYLLALNSEGMFVSAYQFGGVGFIDSHQLGIDSNNNIYLSAQFENTVDLNPMPQTTQNVSSMQFRDNYLLKMNMGTLGNPSFQNAEVAVYPNPATDFLFISSTENMVGEAYTVYNLLGQKVMDGTLTADQKMNVSALKSGLYLLNLSNRPSIKFIKQ